MNSADDEKAKRDRIIDDYKQVTETSQYAHLTSFQRRFNIDITFCRYNDVFSTLL